MDSDMTRSSRLRFGLIGCGGVGPTHAGALLRIEEAEVVATASVKWWRQQHYYDVANWRGTRAGDGGGSLMNQGVHTVDVLQWLTGGIESVFGHTQTAAHNIETEDIAVAALKFNCGAVRTLT